MLFPNWGLLSDGVCPNWGLPSGVASGLGPTFSFLKKQTNFRTWLRIAGFGHSFDFEAAAPLGGHTAGLVLWDRTAGSAAKVSAAAWAHGDAGVLQHLRSGGVDLDLDTIAIKGRPALLHFVINNKLAVVK